MGIRFACHHCQKPLNIKRELAGKRGLCPACGTRVRIPMDDAAHSIPVGSSQTHAPAHGVDGPLNGFDASADGGQQDYVSDDAVRDPLAHVLVSANEMPDARQSDARQHAGASRERAEVLQSTRNSGEATDLVPRLTPTPIKPTPSLLDDPLAVWYVRPPSGGQYGPATGELLRAWISESRVTATSLVWRDGWAQWRTASEVLTEFGAKEQAVASSVSSSSAAGTTETMPVSTSPPGDVPSARGTVAVPVTSSLSGDSKIGKLKGKRSHKRLLMISGLVALSVLLIGVLIYVLQS